MSVTVRRRSDPETHGGGSADPEADRLIGWREPQPNPLVILRSAAPRFESP